MDYNQVIFTRRVDSKGFPYIEKNILAERVRMSAEETTSPRGVEPKLFIRDGEEGIFELCCWEAGGKISVIEQFGSAAEAEESWLERTYKFDYVNSEYYYYDFVSEADAVVGIAEEMDLSVECVESLLRHHELYRQIESRRIAKVLMAGFYKAKANSNGCMTKKLLRAIREADFPCYYMWGEATGFENPRLDVERYFTEDFKKDLNNIKNMI